MRSARPLLKALIVVGNVLTVIGCAGLPNEKAGQSALCVPSHSGCCAVCLQAQNHTFLDSVASNFTGVNFEPLCEPSQNG